MSMKMRKQSTVWAVMLAGLTCGCARTGSPAGAGPELADGQREVTPPRPGTLLERFSFRSPSGDAVSWDADRGTLVAGGALHERPVLFLHVFQPDCAKCRALARALEGEKNDGVLRGAAVVGIAHRGNERDAAAFAEATGVSYPIAVATGSDWARRWGRGDPLFVIDRAGKVAYSRVGFHPADPTVWRKVAADAAAERPVRERFAGRQQLHTGDRFPLIALPDLMHEGRTITLAGDGLVFRDHTGRVRGYRAAVGFFSRY